MHENLYPVPRSFSTSALVKQGDYERMYAESVEDPERFWGRVGRRIDWVKEYSQVVDSSFADDDVHIRWFHDGKLNVASNCLDRYSSRCAARRPRSSGRA